MVGISLLRQKIDVPMGIDPAPFWANLFLYTYENEYMSELISNDKVNARHFLATKRFIGDLGTLNNGGVFSDIYKDIYPPKLQLKIERCGTHATFLNLDITVKDGRFIYKRFDKRDVFPFFIFRVPCIDSNTPKSIFYSALVGEFLRIPRSSLLYKDLNEKAMELLNRMKAQGAQSLKMSKEHEFTIQTIFYKWEYMPVGTGDTWQLSKKVS